MPGKASPPDLTGRASAWLELDPGLTPDAVRVALWQGLAATHFLPDPATHEAILILARRQISSVPALELAIPPAVATLRHRVEEFAAHFFDVPVADRRAIWAEFDRAAAGDPVIQDRLRRLAPGLEFDPALVEPTDPRVRRLAGEILGLFVAPPAFQAAWLREFAYRLDHDPDFKRSARRRALRTLTRHYPTIARLGPDYIKRVRSMPRLVKLRMTALRRAWINALIQGFYRGFLVPLNHSLVFYYRLIGRGQPVSTKTALLVILGYILFSALVVAFWFAFADHDRPFTLILPFLLYRLMPR